jgi:hypothetical protein
MVNVVGAQADTARGFWVSAIAPPDAETTPSASAPARTINPHLPSFRSNIAFSIAFEFS